MSPFSRFLWGLSLVVLVIGVLQHSTWLCSCAWLLLWLGALVQDRTTRRPS